MTRVPFRFGRPEISALILGAVGTFIALVCGLFAFQSAYLRIAILHHPDLRSAFVILSTVCGGLFLLVTWLWHRSDGVTPLVFILIAGGAFRILLLGAMPVLSTDVYRYIWEGAADIHGVSPWNVSPDDAIMQAQGRRPATLPQSLLRAVRRHPAIMRRINHPRLPTIYPPVAQLGFSVAAMLQPFSLLSLKLVTLLADGLTALLLLRLMKRMMIPRCAIIIYWWNPILLNAFYNEVHMDVFVLPFLVAILLCVDRPAWLGAWLALAVAAKFWPLLFLPLLLARFSRRNALICLSIFVPVVLIALSPMLLSHDMGMKSLLLYSNLWHDNDGFFGLVRAGVGAAGGWLGMQANAVRLVARLLAASALGAVLATLLCSRLKTLQVHKQMLIVVAALFLFSPTEFPWYYTWLIPLLALWPVAALLLYSATLGLYHWHSLWPPVVWLEHLPVWLVLFWQLSRQFIPRWRKRTQPAMSGD